MQLNSEVEKMVSHFEEGEAQKAESLAVSILSGDPSNGAAWYVVGMSAMSDSRYCDAEQAFECVNSIAPENLDAWLNWQKSLFSQEKFQEVAANCVDAIERCWDVRHFETYFKLPTEAKTDEVRSSIKAGLFNAMSESDRDGRLYLLLARFYLDSFEYDRAANAYLMASACDRSEQVLAECGRFLYEIDQPTKALKVYGELVEMDSLNSKYWLCMGACFHKLGAFDFAVEAYEKAEQVDPGNLDAMAGLATCVAASSANFSLAAKYIEKVFASLYENREDLSEADKIHIEKQLIPQRAQLTYYQQHLAQYDDQSLQFLDWLATHDDIPDAKLPPPFHVMPIIDSPELLKKTAAAFKPELFKRASLVHDDPAARRIRVGWFGADFHDHATMVLLKGVFREYDRGQFDFRVFSYGPIISDDYRESVKLYADEFYELYGKDDIEITKLAQGLKLDIAIDLKGFTKGGRTSMFSAGLAPIQIGYLGWPGTSGKEYMDYIIADEQVIPAGLRDQFTESVMYMPHSYQPNDDERPIIWQDTSRQQWGLPEEAVVFASFNQIYKVRPDELEVWASILSAVEGSVLWLMTPPNKLTEEAIKNHFNKLGIDPKRIVMAPQVSPFSAHISRIRHADIFLDCFFVNGHTTISDCLFAGVPAVTLPGRQFPARVGASLLKAAGLEQMIATDKEHYREIAIKLASDTDYRLGVRARTAAVVSSSNLFDTKKYVRHLEELFKMAFERSHNGIGPADLKVNSTAD